MSSFRGTLLAEESLFSWFKSKRDSSAKSVPRNDELITSYVALSTYSWNQYFLYADKADVVARPPRRTSYNIGFSGIGGSFCAG